MRRHHSTLFQFNRFHVGACLDPLSVLIITIQDRAAGTDVRCAYVSCAYVLCAAVTDIQTRGSHIHLRWVPAHEGVPGNERAHKEAQSPTDRGKTRRPGGRIIRLRSAAARLAQQRILDDRIVEFRVKRARVYTHGASTGHCLRGTPESSTITSPERMHQS